MKKFSLCHAVLRGMIVFCFALAGSGSLAAPIELSFGHKTVGDSVQYTPNLPAGGFAEPTKRPRFTEKTLNFSWQKNDQISIESSISERQFTTLRDDFGFRQTKLTLRVALQKTNLRHTSLWLSLSSNKTAQLTKNSYTPIGNQVITSVTVQKPSDKNIELGLEHGFHVNQSTSILASTSVGVTDTKHSGIYGDLSRDECYYKFDFGNQGGSINQVNQCGEVAALSRIYPDDNTVQQDFGVSPAIDLRNKSVYGRVGIGITKARQKWSFMAHYYFQKHLRDQLDNRIKQSQGNVYDYNHVISTSVSRSITNKISLTARAEYHLHRYLDEVPVLYTRLTADRFRDSAVFFSVGMTYSLMH